MAKYILVCGDCGQEFVATSGGARALYWHLRKEEGYDHDDAYSHVGQSRVQCDYNHDAEMRKYGWREV